MKKLFHFFVFSLFAQACTQSNNIDEQGPASFPQPKTYPLNKDGGYVTNTVNGDTIQPLINSFGDTIKTGIAIPVQGKLIHPDSVGIPKIIKVGAGAVELNAHPNRHPIPENLTPILVNETELKKIPFTLSSNSPLSLNMPWDGSGNYIINLAGDTIATGKLITTKGKTVSSSYPETTTALALRMKDNAICNLQYLDVDQGMSSSYIYCSLQDRSGNLWFGTAGGGASKYDGKTFVHFTEKEGLSSNDVRAIFEDNYGNIWFGTYGGGACKYDGKSFVHFTEKEGLMNNYVMAIFEDKVGNIWLSTYGAGISKYTNPNSENSGHGILLHFTQNEGLSNNYVLSILEDKIGNIWFGTLGGGASKFTPSKSGIDGEGTFSHFTETEGLSNNVIVSGLADKDGNIWFGTYGGGVSKYDGTSFIRYTETEGLSNNIVVSIFEDKIGNIWFGTYGGGVNKYDEKSFTHFTENEGLSNNFVRSVLEDESGNIWFGTNGGGVCRYDEKSFTHFTENQGLSKNYIWSILEDKNGNIWFGTYGGGVCKYDGNTFVHFTEKEGLSNNIVRAILEDRSGNIWFGTDGGGISKYTPSPSGDISEGTIVNFTKNEGLSHDVIRSILEDKNGNIWIGTTGGGVNKYDGKSFEHFTEKEGLSNYVVRSILEDKNGNMWFGTDGGGVCKYDGKSFEHFTEKEGLSNNVVMSILEDKSGNIWFGTNGGGVSKFDGKSFVHFTENEGLANNIVWSILEDKSGIWLSTEKGLSLIQYSDTLQYGASNDLDTSATQKTKMKDGYSIIALNKLDGLKGVDFYAGSALLDSKNRIWWGSGKGLEMLNLNLFQPSDKIPHVELKSIKIQEQFIDYRNLNDSTKGSIHFDSIARFENYPFGLILPYDQNHLTFCFSAIDWGAPHKLKYQYTLAGLDENWSPVTEKTEADYRNIPYGTFTFKVRAIGESQIWGPTFEYSFTVNPPWWHTWWFRGLMSVSFILLLYFIYRWRTAALRERQKQLEKTVEERTEELVQKNIIVEKQKELVEEKHKEITDSINYAERIQRSFLATKELLDEHLAEYFVFFRPKDVVSGDFFWASKLSNGNFALVTADSTGHGVPGAIMSILNISSLEKSVEIGLTKPADIFNHTRQTIISRLKKDGSKEGGKDGMDASLICFDFENKNLEYSAANNPIWVVRKNEVIELSPDKMPVGKHDKDQTPFTQNEFDLQTGDVVYALTDGFPDQFGGEKGKKFMHKKLKELLVSISNDPMEMQREKLSTVFANWKGTLEQVDDVCVIGVRV